MEHDLELIIARLEILEIEVCNILQNPGNIAKRTFLIQSYPGNIGNLIFRISHILEILEIFFSYFVFFFFFSQKNARRNVTQNAPTDEPRSLI